MERYLLGIDAGTTSFKGALFTEDRALVASCQKDYTLLTPREGYSEFSPEEYFRIFCALVGELLERAGAPAERIAALSISSQGETLICLDGEGRPLGNAIVWLDNRAIDEARALSEQFGREAIYNHTGQSDMTATWPAAKLLWLQRHEPDRFEKTAYFLLLEDYLLYRLTGARVGETNLWASSALLDIHAGAWWPEMLEALGLSPARLPRLMPCAQPVGPILESACAQTGLHPSTLAVTGALDQTLNAIGAGITRPGSVSETTGSCLAVSMTLNHFLPFAPDEPVTCQNHAVPGRYTVLLWSQSAGMTLKWFARAFYPEFGEDLDAAYAQMNLDAAAVPACADGLLMLPHLTGASNPEHDPLARGVFSGITLAHGRAHFTRAIFEAVAYMLKRNLDQLARLGATPERVYCMGGGAKSPLWLSVKASVAQTTMCPLAARESACLGAALLAGVGAGLYASIDQAAEGLLRAGTPVLPDEGQRAPYERGYRRYIALYEALKPFFASSDH